MYFPSPPFSFLSVYAFCSHYLPFTLRTVYFPSPSFLFLSVYSFCSQYLTFTLRTGKKTMLATVSPPCLSLFSFHNAVLFTFLCTPFCSQHLSLTPKTGSKICLLSTVSPSSLSLFSFLHAFLLTLLYLPSSVHISVLSSCLTSIKQETRCDRHCSLSL